MGWDFDKLPEHLKRKINEQLHKASDTGTAPKLERALGNGPLAACKAEKGNSSRVLIRVTSIRNRLLDEDNLAEKYHVDACRYAGLLLSDEPGKTKIEVGQRKAGKGEVERTEIEITYPE